MPNLIARWQKPWCPICKAPAGPDCPDTALSRIAAVKRDRARIRLTLRRIRKEYR